MIGTQPAVGLGGAGFQAVHQRLQIFFFAQATCGQTGMRQANGGMGQIKQFYAIGFALQRLDRGFNPQTFALKFSAVLDDHAPGIAGWRGHVATFEPDFSAEWKAWKSMDRKAMAQVTFAEWIQEHEDDINSGTANMPTVGKPPLDKPTKSAAKPARAK